jgi:hypothetical protein
VLLKGKSKAHRETAGVTEGFRGATLVDDGGEPDNDRSLHARCSEYVRASELGDVMRDLQASHCMRNPCD